jgi:hypothetical protein
VGKSRLARQTALIELQNTTNFFGLRRTWVQTQFTLENLDLEKSVIDSK